MATVEPPNQIKRPQGGGTTKVMTSMAFIVSLVVHLVIFLFVGSVVIFEGAIPPNLFNSMSGEMISEESADEMELPPLLEEEIQPEQLETPMEDMSLDTEVDLTDAMSSSDLIVSSVPTLTPSFPKVMPSVGSDTGTKLVTGARKPGQGKSGPGGPRTANIFGRTVSASNFGAMLDISNSTHKTINVAVAEIRAGFPDAILVLVPGCGINPAEKGKVIKGDEFEKNIRNYHFKGLSASDNKKSIYTAGFFERLKKSNKEFAKLWDRAVKDDRGYVLHLDFPAKPNDKGQVIRIAGSQHAVTFLKDQGCDVIYWMADYADKIHGDTAKNLAKELKRGDVQLIQHDFDGAQKNDQKQRAIMKQMVDETGGQQIIGAR